MLTVDDPPAPPDPAPPPVMPGFAWSETWPALIVWAVIAIGAIWSAAT